MSSIEYSFIIPHHNSPDLLSRCLESIPQRDDIEVIVIDDNSSFDKRPVINRKDVHTIFIDKEHSLGAGRARNYGISKATGKWLIFADCDDYYSEEFVDEIDLFKDTSVDAVFWGIHYLYNCTNKTEMPDSTCQVLEALKNDPSNVRLRKSVIHKRNACWDFMVKRSLVEQINARFEEVPKGNDALFHHTVGLALGEIGVIPKKLYYWTINEGSITHILRPKEEVIKNLKHSMVFVRLRLDADAIETIPPFLEGLGKIRRNYGAIFTLKYVLIKFISAPWIIIWSYKLWRQFK